MHATCVQSKNLFAQYGNVSFLKQETLINIYREFLFAIPEAYSYK